MTTKATIQYFNASRTPIPDPMNSLMRLSPTQATRFEKEKPVVVSKDVVAVLMSEFKAFL